MLADQSSEESDHDPVGVLVQQNEVLGSNVDAAINTQQGHVVILIERCFH